MSSAPFSNCAKEGIYAFSSVPSADRRRIKDGILTAKVYISYTSRSTSREIADSLIAPISRERVNNELIFSAFLLTESSALLKVLFDNLKKKFLSFLVAESIAILTTRAVLCQFIPMMRKFSFICNWKEYGSIEKLNDFAKKITESSIIQQIDILLAPPVALLGCMSNTRIASCAQFIDHINGNGRLRGSCLRSISCVYAMCGHVEDYDRGIMLQISECIEYDITPIVFISDYLLNDFDYSMTSTYVYEPRENVGADNAAELTKIGGAVMRIKQANKSAKVLYGGSVDINNAQVISKLVDGLCIGRASRDPAKLLDLIKSVVYHVA